MSSVFFWTPKERKRESWVIWFLLYDDYDYDYDDDHDSSDDDDHDRSYDSCDDDYDICDDDDDHVSFIMIMDGTEDDDYDNSDYKAMI